MRYELLEYVYKHNIYLFINLFNLLIINENVRTMKKYYILAAVAMTMVACNNDETTKNEQANLETSAMRFEASVGGLDATRAGKTVQSTSFAAGEEINVERTDATTSTLASAIYVTEAAVANQNAMTLKGGETALLWPASGTVNIDAFYPSTITSATTSFSVQEDQSTDANYKLSDLMYATNIPTQAKTTNNAAVGLTFNHALTKIVVNLSAASNGGFDPSDIAGCTITLHAKKTATIVKGVVTPIKVSEVVTDYNTSAPSTITMGTGSGVAAVIVPQLYSSTPTNFITITTAGGHSVSYRLTTSKLFEAGKVYTYNLSVGAQEINLQSTTITNWVEGVGATDDTLVI